MIAVCILPLGGTAPEVARRFLVGIVERPTSGIADDAKSHPGADLEKAQHCEGKRKPSQCLG